MSGRLASLRYRSQENLCARRIVEMKWCKAGFWAAMLCLSLLSYPTQSNQAQALASGASSEAKITVLSPMGTPPAYTLKPMAARPASLDGKTIYVVDDGYVGGDLLLKEMVNWFNTNTKAKAIYKRKAGSFWADDPPLFAEIKEKGDAMVMGMGH
jgi:hypothetical protein